MSTYSHQNLCINNVMSTSESLDLEYT